MKELVTTKAPAEQVVKDIRRATRTLHSSEDKIRIVMSGHRRSSPCPAARDVPGGTRRGTPQRETEVLRRSPAQRRKTAQGHHRRRRQKAGHHRQRSVQKPSELDRHDDLTDAVARLRTH
jgi:hypothetical protein